MMAVDGPLLVVDDHYERKPRAVMAPTRSRGRLRKTLQYVLGLVAGGVAMYVLLGRTGELSGAAAALSHVNLAWVAVAASAELAAMLAYASVQYRMLRVGGVDVGLGAVAVITFAAYSIQNSLPAGPAWSAVFAFREYRRRGADRVVATWSLAVVSVLSGVSLAAIALVGTVVARGQASSLGLAWIVMAVAALAALLGFAVHRTMHGEGVPGQLVRVVRRVQRILHWPKGDVTPSLEEALDRLRAVAPRGRDWVAGAGLAAANWGFDCACLAIAFVALGAPVPWRGLLLAYGGGQLAANLPITPGGLGVVEGSLTIALVYYGGTSAATVAAVLLYRIISFWALLPLGWTGLLALRVRGRRLEVQA